MFRKYLSLALIGLLLNPALFSTATAAAQTDAEFAEKVKANIAKLGTGKDAKVTIKLKDGTKLKGFVNEIKESGFFLTSEETGISSEIAYSQVNKAKGQNSSNGNKILLRSVVIIGVILLYGYYLSRSSEY